MPTNRRQSAQRGSSEPPLSDDLVGWSHCAVPAAAVTDDTNSSDQNSDSDTRSKGSNFKPFGRTIRTESATGSNNTPLQQQQQRPPMSWREREALKQKELEQKEKEARQPQRQQRQQQISELEQEMILLQTKLHDMQLQVQMLKRLDEIEDRLLAVKKEQQELGLEEARLTDEQQRIFTSVLLAATTEVAKEQE